MKAYHLSKEEDMRLHLSIQCPGNRYLYEYFIELPLEKLKLYPKKGYRFWMGRKAKSPDALAMRDYILYWRLFAISFRKEYSRDYLQSIPYDKIGLFVRTYIKKTPLWAYEGPIRDAVLILHKMP